MAVFGALVDNHWAVLRVEGEFRTQFWAQFGAVAVLGAVANVRAIPLQGQLILLPPPPSPPAGSTSDTQC